MREKGQTEVAKTLETPVFSRGIEILTEKYNFTKGFAVNLGIICKFSVKQDIFNPMSARKQV